MPASQTSMFNKRQIDLMGLLVCLAVTAMVAYFGFLPAHNQRKAMIAEKEVLRRQRDKSTQAALHLSDIRRRFHDLHRKAASHPLQLKPLSYLNQRLSDITAMAISDGLEIDKIEPGNSYAGDFYVTVPLRMSGRGDFQSTVDFLHRLHLSVPDIAILALNLSASPRSATTGSAFHFDLVWHAAPQSE